MKFLAYDHIFLQAELALDPAPRTLTFPEVFHNRFIQIAVKSHGHARPALAFLD
jgi:hypothetical protein